MGKVYLFYGDEKYDLENRVQKIKNEYNNLEVGLNLFYISSDNISQLANVVQGVTFFGNDKLIVIKDTKLKFNINLINDLDDGISVVVIEDSVDKRTSEYKALTKMAECVEFKHLDAKEMISYIMQILKKYNISISYDVAEYMQSVCGDDKTNNINELQKIVTYIEPGSTVTKDIIDKVCSKTLNAKIFDVLSKIVNRQKIQALAELDEILQQKEPVIKIAIMLYKQVKQMYMIKYLKQKNANDIASILAIHPFVFKNLSKSCDGYTLEELKNIIFAFDDYDEKTKIGEMDFEIGLKKIICSM